MCPCAVRALCVLALLAPTTLASTVSCSRELGPQDALLVVDVQNSFMERMALPSDPSSLRFPVPAHAVEEGEGGARFVKAGSLAVQRSSEIIAAVNEWVRAVGDAHGAVFFSLDWHDRDHCSFCRNGTRESNPEGFKGDEGAICGPITANTEGFDWSGRCVDAGSQIAFQRGGMMQWPVHCVKGEFSARFSPFLHVPPNAIVVKKGFQKHLDSYSALGGVLSPSAHPNWDVDDGGDEADLASQPTFAQLLAERNATRLFVVGLATDYCVRASALDARDLRFTEVVLIEEAARGVAPGSSEQAVADLKRHGVKVVSGVSAVADVLRVACEVQEHALATTDPSLSLLVGGLLCCVVFLLTLVVVLWERRKRVDSKAR